MPARRRDPVSVPRTLYSSSRPTHHDYGIDESISRAGFFSNAVLEDTDAAAAHSRAKDYDLLRNTNSAIVATEMHSTPRAAVASMKARASSVPPKVQSRPVRLQQQLVNRPKVAGSPQLAPNIVFLSTPPLASNPARYDSTPVVPNEVPWRVRAGSVSNANPRASRAGSLPPRPRSYHPGSFEPVTQMPLGTEGLKAHRAPIVMRSRAGSVPPQRPQSFHSVDSQPPRLFRAGSVQPLRRQSYHPMQENKSVGTEGLRAHRPPPVSALNRAQSLSRLSRRPLDFGVDDELERRCMSKQNAKRKPVDGKKPGIGVSFRAVSEPPPFMAPSETYPCIVDVQPRTRQLFARRGLVGSSMPIKSVLTDPSFAPSNRAKAAIIGSKMEANDAGKSKRKPRPLYHVEKSREPSAGSTKSAIFYNSPLESGGLQSSRPPLPKQTDRKAIRTVDGFSKPKNVMSWEYRVESRVSPDDLIYQPQRFGRMRDQVRSAQEKMHRHRQLLDRYLDPDMKPSGSLASRNNNTNTSASSAGTDPNNAPMSDVRRRVRRTLAKTKSQPDYYLD